MKHMKVRILMYFIGLFIMTIGIAFSVKSNLGVSPVSSIPYTMTCVWGNRDGKSNHPFPRRTGTDPDSAFTEKIQTRSISADCSRRYIRIFYDIL